MTRWTQKRLRAAAIAKGLIIEDTQRGGFIIRKSPRGVSFRIWPDSKATRYDYDFDLGLAINCSLKLVAETFQLSL